MSEVTQQVIHHNHFCPTITVLPQFYSFVHHGTVLTKTKQNKTKKKIGFSLQSCFRFPANLTIKSNLLVPPEGTSQITLPWFLWYHCFLTISLTATTRYRSTASYSMVASFIMFHLINWLVLSHNTIWLCRNMVFYNIMCSPCRYDEQYKVFLCV